MVPLAAVQGVGLGIKSQSVRFVSRLVRDEKANVGIILALALPVLFATGGFAIDLASYARHKAQLGDALDAVALSATQQVVSGSLDIDDKQRIQADAMRLFTANIEASKTASSRIDIKDLQVEVFRVPGGVRTTGRYTAEYKMWFGGLVGFEVMPLNKEVEARSSTPTYIDFHLAIDVSPSMGLAANAAETSRMKALMGCAFACHTRTDGNDSLGRARRSGIKLRIDSIKDAANLAINIADSRAFEAGQYRFSVHTISKTLVELQKLTADLALARSKLADMQLSLHSGGLTAHSYFTPSLAELERTIETPGTGRSPDSRLKYVIFATDGLEHWGDAANRRRTGALDPAICQRMKDRGIIVLVIYTTYLPIPENSAWRTMVRPYEHQLAPNLEQCASPDGFFTAEDDAEINYAMQEIFTKATGRNRITR
jgi:hypothetical protein